MQIEVASAELATSISFSVKHLKFLLILPSIPSSRKWSNLPSRT